MEGVFWNASRRRVPIKTSRITMGDRMGENAVAVVVVGLWCLDDGKEEGGA